MARGFVIAVLMLLATATARPEPQFIFSAGPYYGAGIPAAYTGYSDPAAAAPLAPVVPAAVAAPALPVPTYSVYPSSVTAYSYGYKSTFAEVPIVNPSANLYYNSAYSSLPLQYSSLPYTYAPAAPYFNYLA